MTLSSLLMTSAIQLGCCLCAIVIVGIAISSIWYTAREGIQYLKQLHQVPCSGCTYFTGDYRLKCTVHPIIALTEEAIACRDYEPRPHTMGQPVVLPCHKKIPCSSISTDAS